MTASHPLTHADSGPRSDTGTPASLLTKIMDVPDDTLLSAIERHPTAWALLTRPPHREESR